ncbi:MAG: radical SAM protein, partial [Halobacteriovoraceae bacterium]|nr:radical SAM protein [Halobacteriovoraceae bacterium]
MMEKIMMWRNVLKRINYFSDMYPMSTILKEAIFFPLDYLRPDTDITTVRNVTLSITHRCNIKCSMCFYHLNLHDAKEMNLETFKKIIQQVHKTKPGIILTGGEPFMHKNLVEFVKYAKSFNLPVQIFTNGTLMKPEVLHQLFDAKLDYLNITVLGNKEVHDTVAQVKGSYDRLVKNLEYASQIKASTKIILNYSITPESVETLDEPIKLANQYNCEGVRYQHYNFLTTKELASQKAIMNKEMG